MTPRRRAAFVIEVDLDPIPGFGHTPETWRTWLERTLSYGAEHYRPTVTPAPNGGRGDADRASRDAECAYLWDRLADAIELLDRRWAAVGCDACRRGGCTGHLAEEALTINGHRVVDLEGRLADSAHRLRLFADRTGDYTADGLRIRLDDEARRLLAAGSSGVSS